MTGQWSFAIGELAGGALTWLAIGIACLIERWLS